MTEPDLHKRLQAMIQCSQGTYYDLHRIIAWHVGDDFTIEKSMHGHLRVRVASDCTDAQIDAVRRDVSAAASSTVFVEVVRRGAVPQAPPQPALPWPWRACKGGRVLAANGETGTKGANRRDAVQVVRETGAFLRGHGLLDACNPPQAFSDDELPQPGAIVINGQTVHIADTRTITVDALVAAINSQTIYTAVRSSEDSSTVCLQMHLGLTFVTVQVSGDD